MTWFGWTVVALAALQVISLAYKARTPAARDVARVALVVNTLLILGVFLVGTGHL